MTKTVCCGNVKIGGGNPISIQSMTNVSSHDHRALVDQISKLEDAGCDIVRVAVPDMEAVSELYKLKSVFEIPIVADIHFDYRLAIESIKAGADKIRINPGNIGSAQKIEKIIKEASNAKVPIRIGVNSGSLEKEIVGKYGGVTAEGLAESAVKNAHLFESIGFKDIVLSIKSSDVKITFDAYKIVSGKLNYPLHIGVTEAGTPKRGIIKSSVGIGALLLSGIGDTLRVSLTGDPVEEVRVAKEILSATGIRKNNLEMVSCPTCGRTGIDLEDLANSVEDRLSKYEFSKPVKIAVMGCVVNGPGEAKEADYGVAGGEKRGIIFEKGEIVEKVPEAELLDEFIKHILSDDRVIKR